MTETWRPNRPSSEMSDRAVQSTALYRTLRSLNADLPSAEVLELARDNIERKWAQVVAEREAEAEAEAQAQAAEEREQRITELLAHLGEQLREEDRDYLRISVESKPMQRVGRGWAGYPPGGFDIRYVEETSDNRIPLIKRLDRWMEAAEGGGHDRFGNRHRAFWPFEVAALIGCRSPQTVSNWLLGYTRQPQAVHRRHLRAMMENYSYRQLRDMLRRGESISC